MNSRARSACMNSRAQPQEHKEHKGSATGRQGLSHRNTRAHQLCSMRAHPQKERAMKPLATLKEKKKMKKKWKDRTVIWRKSKPAMKPLATWIEEKRQKCEKLELLFGKRASERASKQASNETFGHFIEKKKENEKRQNCDLGKERASNETRCGQLTLMERKNENLKT